jgi:hypothetical protein
MHDDWDEIDFARVTTAAASTTRRVVTVQIAALGNEGDDNTSERGDDVEVIQPLGLMAVPSITATTEAPFMRLGDRQVALGIIDKGATPQTVEAGEVRLYGPGASNASAVLRIRADGSIVIQSKTGQNIALNVDAAGNIVLDGGSLKVARATDPVSVTLTALQIAGIIAPAGGGPCTGGPITITGTIDTGAGATHVLA